MPESQPALIALDAAWVLFEKFRIEPNSPSVQRWHRDDGFRQIDLEDTLHDSPLCLQVDWRENLEGPLDTIERQLGRLGLSLDVDVNDDGDRAVIEFAGARKRVRFNSADDTFNSVIRAVNSLVTSHAAYRSFRCSEGTDGRRYGILANSAWQEMEREFPTIVESLFSKIPSRKHQR